MAVFFLCMSISNAFVHHIRNNSLLSQFHAKVSKIGWIWLLMMRIGPVLEGILSVATTFWRVIELEIGILKLLPYSRIPEGRWGCLKAPDFSVFFFFSALVSTCCILLQPSESLPIGCFSYSATTAQPPSVASTILITLFFFFSLEITAFNDVATWPCSSEMLSMMSCRSSIVSVVNSCCSLWPFCLKVSTWIFRFFSTGSLSLFFSNLVLDFQEPWVKVTENKV